MTISPALEGTVVVEVSSEVRGRYCGRLFAELGARVVRVELPRSVLDADRPWLDPGKESVVLDWRTAAGAELLHEICAKADVLIEDQLDPEATNALATDSLAAFSGLVHVSLTPFGLKGPWAGRDAHDLNISALSGMALINQVGDGPPVSAPGPQTEIIAALSGFMGALAALEERDQSGLGQVVEVSSLEAMVNVLSPQVLQQSYLRGGGSPAEVDFLFPCANGWISLYIVADPAWDVMVSVFELPVDADDPRFATQVARRNHFAAVRELVIPRLATYTRRELFDMLSAMRVVCGMVMEPRDLVDDVHLLERRAFVGVEGTDCRVPRVPIRTRGESLPENLTLAGHGDHTGAWLGRAVSR